MILMFQVYILTSNNTRSLIRTYAHTQKTTRNKQRSTQSAIHQIPDGCSFGRIYFFLRRGTGGEVLLTRSFLLSDLCKSRQVKEGLRTNKKTLKTNKKIMKLKKKNARKKVEIRQVKEVVPLWMERGREW